MGIVYSSGKEFADRKFLVVDDFQGMRSMLREMLKNSGAQHVDLACHGREALGMLEQKPYDVIICDHNLGAGKNGQQILEEARQRDLIGSATVWVMISAEKTLDMVIGAVEYQPDDYLIKPITAATLETRLEKQLARKAALASIDKAIRTKNFGRAIALCDEQLRNNAGHATDLLRTKSELFLTLGEYDKAKEVFQQVLAIRDIPWAQTGLAKVSFFNGDFEGARAVLNGVIAANNTYLEGYDWLAKTLEQLGEVDQARQVVARAAELSPNSLTRQKTLGELALKQGDLDAAEKALRKTIVLGENAYGNTPTAHLALAKVLAEKNDPEEAVRLLQQVRKDFPEPEAALQAKVAEGMVLRATGNKAGAEKLAKEIAEAVATGGAVLPATASLEAAQLMLEAGDKAQADNLLRKVVGNDHENEQLIEQVKQVFAAAGMAEDGQKLVEASRREAIEVMNQGVRLASEGKLGEALESLRSAASMLPGNTRILLNLAYVACKYMGENGVDEQTLEEARGHLERVRRIRPGEPRHAQIQAMVESLAQGRG